MINRPFHTLNGEIFEVVHSDAVEDTVHPVRVPSIRSNLECHTGFLVEDPNRLPFVLGTDRYLVGVANRETAKCLIKEKCHLDPSPLR